MIGTSSGRRQRSAPNSITVRSSGVREEYAMRHLPASRECNSTDSGISKFRSLGSSSHPVMAVLRL